MKELKQTIKALVGSVLIVGDFGEKFEETLDKNTKITETYWVNANSQVQEQTDEPVIDVAYDFNFAKLHKYLKKGIDNTFCNYNEIKKVVPKFIRESLRVTKKNIYIIFDKKSDLEFVLKKYKRYQLSYEVKTDDKFNLLIIEANDIIVNEFKEIYYYLYDNVEKFYNDISEAL